MRQGIKDFKKEVENDLVAFKNEWFKIALEEFVNASPVPGRAWFSKGPFINTVKITYDNKTVRFKEIHGGKNLPNFKLPNKIHMVTLPYSKIGIRSLTSEIPYNINIEEIGWPDKGDGVRGRGPYMPFQHTIGVTNWLFNHEEGVSFSTYIKLRAY